MASAREPDAAAEPGSAKAPEPDAAAEPGSAKAPGPDAAAEPGSAKAPGPDAAAEPGSAEAPGPGPGPLRVWSDVGDRLRHARAQSQMTVRALAASIGVSPSLISQIETGKVRPSVNTLYALAVELGLSVDEILFGAPAIVPRGGADRADGVRVQRGTSRASVAPAPGVLWERLTGASEPGVDFLYLTYAPGGESVPEGSSHRHAGREWGYVVGGTLRVDVGGDNALLQAGDSITYASTEVHRLSNPGDQDMHAVWFILGRRHLTGGAPG